MNKKYVNDENNIPMTQYKLMVDDGKYSNLYLLDIKSLKKPKANLK